LSFMIWGNVNLPDRLCPRPMNDLYPSLYTAYRWLVPSQFNIADVCVHRWALTSHEGRSPAVYYETDAREREVWTYTRVSETAKRLANGLQHMQVAPGDRVAIVMTQRPETLVALTAVLSLGAVAVPLSAQASSVSLRACLLDAAARAGALFVDAPHPTAAVCYNDTVALGLMLGLVARGIQPGAQFAVTGFDDIAEAAAATPPLTTLAAQPRERGRQAVQLLLARIAAPDAPPVRTMAPVELCVRASSAIPPA